jgi:3-phosphoglycerate kinase
MLWRKNCSSVIIFKVITTLIVSLDHVILIQLLFSLQGRPKGVTPKYSLKPLVPRLSELLGVNVCIMKI